MELNEIKNEEFRKKGYRIKLYDCFRPLNVQKKMWAIKKMWAMNCD